MLFPSKIISKYIMSMLSRLLFLGLPKLEVNKANQGSNSSALEKKTCLIIRLDGIGDYVLFRNYIEKIKDSKKYKGYSVSLLCDEALKGFADKLDGEYLDEIIWFNRKKFFKKPLYGLNFLHKLSGLKFHTIISPVYTRNYFFTDTFVRLINAKEQIGSTGDEIDISLGQKNISNGWYTSLVSATSGTMFEFYRNKEFFENLIGEEITLPRPKIALPAKKSSFVKEIEKEMKNKYFAVLFIGGSDDLRRWSKEKFVKLGKHLNEEYKLNVFLCGSLKEKKDGEFIARNLGNYCVDLVGKTDLYELLFLLNGAQLLVSNETGVVHMACALRDDLKTLVLSNGNNFGRFAPYPSIYKKYSVVLPQTYGKKLGTHEGEVLGKPSSLDIDEISFEDLKEILVTMY